VVPMRITYWRVMNPDDLRPSRLDKYIGQEHIKEPLMAALASAKARGAPLPHVLLSGPPGLGKTTLSLILAAEMGWPMIDLIGSTVGTPKDLSYKLMFLQTKTIFFVDEIHAMRTPVQEVLYPVLEDGRLLYRGEMGSKEVVLKPLTVVGATTHLGKLAQPFIDRFQLQFELQFYSPQELVTLGGFTAHKLCLKIDPIGLEAIAIRSRGTPRYVNNYLKWLRDFGLYRPALLPKVISEDYVVSILWDKLKIDNKGLSSLDRQYLRALEAEPTAVGLESIAATLRQQEVTLENTVEPYLLYSGMIKRIRNGRQITDLGREHLASLRRRKK
jgi:Holliday junction DNA helicase RuvB